MIKVDCDNSDGVVFNKVSSIVNHPKVIHSLELNRLG